MMMAKPLAQTAPALDIRDLRVSFPKRSGGMAHPVNGIDLTIGQGQTLCLVGESGSGKSMTARAIMQLVPRPGRVSGGQMTLTRANGDVVDLARLAPFGRDIRRLRGREIGMIFQEPMSSLGPIHRIGSQIIEAIRVHEPVSRAEARARAIELLRQVDIRDAESAIDRYPFEFSGGMRQRAMIAIALSCRPRLLIADEPTTALDVTTQAEILDLLRRLQRDTGMSMLFITHDMGVVAEIADDVAVMQNGVLREVGPVRRIFAEPQDDYTRLLLRMAQKLEGMGETARTAALPAVAAGVDATPPLLSVRNLSVAFGATRSWFAKPSPGVIAVRDVSFDLRHGESLGIVGESGSGKTTLARAIMRIHEPTSGQILYRHADGRSSNLPDLSQTDFKAALREIRMIFQDPFASLNPRMKVADLIAEPLVVQGVLSPGQIRDRVAELLEAVELSPDMGRRYPHAFSGGQRQRIGIARALAPRPRLIIADEATAALDVSLRGQMLDLLARLQREMDLSFIFIGHDIGVVRYFCDRIGVMYHGEMLELDDADSICTAPAHPYTRALLSAVPRPDPTLRGTLTRHRYVPEAGR